MCLLTPSGLLRLRRLADMKSQHHPRNPIQVGLGILMGQTPVGSTHCPEEPAIRTACFMMLGQWATGGAQLRSTKTAYTSEWLTAAMQFPHLKAVLAVAFPFDASRNIASLDEAISTGTQPVLTTSGFDKNLTSLKAFSGGHRNCRLKELLLYFC